MNPSLRCVVFVSDQPERSKRVKASSSFFVSREALGEDQPG